MLDVVDCLFADWHEFRAGEIDREGLQVRVEPIMREFQEILERGRCLSTDRKTARFCRNLQSLWPSLWLFTTIEGLEPTNNHAERILRTGVLWRKNAFGCQSAEGCQFVERMLTVVRNPAAAAASVYGFSVSSDRRSSRGAIRTATTEPSRELKSRMTGSSGERI